MSKCRVLNLFRKFQSEVVGKNDIRYHAPHLLNQRDQNLLQNEVTAALAQMKSTYFTIHKVTVDENKIVITDTTDRQCAAGVHRQLMGRLSAPHGKCNGTCLHKHRLG